MCYRLARNAAKTHNSRREEMGQKLVRGFEHVLESKGLKDRMLVAMKSGIPSLKAEELPDSDENVKKLEDAIREITGETVKL